jgi:hypothetical protein
MSFPPWHWRKFKLTPKSIWFTIVIGDEFWLGLDNIYELTQVKNYTLRVTMENFDGVIKTAFYTDFKILENVSRFNCKSELTYLFSDAHYNIPVYIMWLSVTCKYIIS